MASNSQEKHVENILPHVALTDHHIVDTPLELSVRLQDTNDEHLDDSTPIIILLAVNSTLGSLVLASLMLPYLSLLPSSFTTLTFVFFDNFVEPFVDGCSSLALALSSFRRTMMQPRLVIPSITVCLPWILLNCLENKEDNNFSFQCWGGVELWRLWQLRSPSSLRILVSASTPTPLSWDSTNAINIVDDPSKHELTKNFGVDS